jgi:hypothetical protein
LLEIAPQVVNKRLTIAESPSGSYPAIEWSR